MVFYWIHVHTELTVWAGTKYERKFNVTSPNGNSGTSEKRRVEPQSGLPKCDFRSCKETRTKPKAHHRFCQDTDGAQGENTITNGVIEYEV